MIARSPSGFTLIEMTVVLMILVIVAAAVVPALHGAARQGDLDGVTARVAASARYARETATGRAVTVDLAVQSDPAAVLLEVEPEDAVPTAFGSSTPTSTMTRPGANGSDAAQQPLAQRYARVLLPQGVTAQLESAAEGTSGQTLAAGEPLRFPPDGRPDGGAIVLRDARGHERRILVIPGTGQVVGTEGG